MLTNIFYLSPTREKKGPVNEDQLKAANISPDTLVWMPGLSAWTPAKQVPQIAALLPQPEPAPAPAPAPVCGSVIYCSISIRKVLRELTPALHSGHISI